MSLEGKHVGEFEIIERLGQGGMGAVYKAKQTSLDRIVALKTLQSSLAGDLEFISRFRQEAKAAAALNHQNLVQVYSAGETEGLHWFAMEYVEGESAKTRIQRKGRLDPLEAIAIAMRVATALEYGWSKAGLIHRDIKPENIFLSGDGEVKLGDLGLAKSAGQAQGQTTTGHSMGTPHYMSPEQVESTKDVDLRADIYSLGCTLYHLLCGQPPYAGGGAVAVMIKHMSAPVPDLRSVWPGCPAELAEVLRKMMQKDPGGRQKSHREVSADLRRARDALAAAGACPVTIQSKAHFTDGKGTQGTRLAVWVGGGVVALAVITSFVYSTPWKSVGLLPKPERQWPAAQNSAPSSNQQDGSPTATPATARTLMVATTPQPEATPVPTTPMPAPQPLASSTPAPPTPAPFGISKPATEIEKWLAQVDGRQMQGFHQQVLKPFEAGVADLRARYLASLDVAIVKTSGAGKFADTLILRTERQEFEKARNVAADDGSTPAIVRTLRASFRQQLTKLDQDRIARARVLLGKYDAILAKNQTALTQNQHIDDALLLKTKREEIAAAWLMPSAIIAVGAIDPAESAKSGSSVLATKDQPFVNTLGMKFVPVPILGGPTGGQEVLFSVWDTRVQDYEACIKETKREWSKPGFPQGPTHPAVMVSWEDAQVFSQWLTIRDQTAGLLRAEWHYRLPTDHEWSCAVELGAREDAEKLPSEKNQEIADVYPWGTHWPPPDWAGNYASPHHVDGFRKTSPVGSFAANRFGLFDIGGNVWQWCEDWYDIDQKDRVLRGASWFNNDRGDLLSSYRHHFPPGYRFGNGGFRCVIVIPAR